MTRAIPGGIKPKGKPRGRPFPKGVSPNPSGKPKGTVHADIFRRKVEQDARLLARSLSVEAIQGLATLMRGVVKVEFGGETVEVIVPPSVMATAMVAILDRGYGRPPQALEIYGGDVQPEEREGSALEIITRQLDQQLERERQEGGAQQLN